MKGTILLNYDDNTQKVEDEEKTRFLKSLLDQMGVPIDDFWTADNSLSVNQKIKLRGILATYAIQIIDDLDGHMEMYVEGEKIAEWYKPTYKLKIDLNQKDRKKQLYLEMYIEYASVFEETSE